MADKTRAEMQPALYTAANAACIYQYTDGFCSSLNSPTCFRCWGNAERVMAALKLSASATAWLFRFRHVIEKLSEADAENRGDYKSWVHPPEAYYDTVQRRFNAAVKADDGTPSAATGERADQ